MSQLLPLILVLLGIALIASKMLSVRDIKLEVETNSGRERLAREQQRINGYRLFRQLPRWRDWPYWIRSLLPGVLCATAGSIWLIGILVFHGRG